MERLQSWVSKTSEYPPSNIFYQVNNKDKQERRCKAACEVLFTFNTKTPEDPANVLRSMRAAWRELEVLYILGFDGMKNDCINSAKDHFLTLAKASTSLMSSVYKTDPTLNVYYQEWAISSKDLSELVKKL